MRYNKVQVLDHGYIQLIEAYGHGLEGDWQMRQGVGTMTDHEVGIIEAARQSTQGSFRGWETDSKLLKFLYNNKHMTPFEFSGMVIELQAPIFVLREWMRHRTQSYNEMSARYAPLPDLNYIPTAERIMINGEANKQAQAIKGSAELTIEKAEEFRQTLGISYQEAENCYQDALNMGVPKELARLYLPVGRYSKMRASANLRNWLQFMTLRCDPNAQWEIRQYANAVADIIKEIFPRTYEAWKES